MTLRPSRALVLSACLLATLATRDALADDHPVPIDSTAVAPEAALTEAARGVLREAVDAANAGDFATCRTKAAGVWDSIKHPLAAGLLGSCEVELGQYRQGAEHLRFALDHDEGKAQGRLETMQKDYERAKAKVSILTVQSNVDGADVMLDGAFVGKTPLRVYVEPGTRDLLVRSGKVEQKQNVPLEAGRERVLAVTLDLGGDVATPKPGGGGRPAWPGIVGLSVGGASIVVGAVLIGVAKGKAGEADDLDCTTGDAATRTACVANGDDLYSSANGLQGGGIAALSIGGALAIGGLVYLVLPDGGGEKPPTDAPKASFVPAFGPGFTGGTLTVRY
jgi:hypothetical protein